MLNAWLKSSTPLTSQSPMSPHLVVADSSTTVGTGVVACAPTVMALVASNVPLVVVTTTMVVAPMEQQYGVSALRSVPEADETAWLTGVPTECAPKFVNGMVSVVPTGLWIQSPASGASQEGRSPTNEWSGRDHE